jgi:excisionase family DNA binding protein
MLVPSKSPPSAICLTVEQACLATGMGKTALYSALDSGALPAKKWGKRTLILKADLQRYLSNLEAYIPQVGGKNV